MICSIGIDIVEVTRFVSWNAYSNERLERVFSLQELAGRPTGSGEQFFAARFAAKEAFYKALCSYCVQLGYTEHGFTFAFARLHVQTVSSTWGVPVLEVNWKAFEGKVGKSFSALHTHVSLSHEKQHAVAVVILERSST